jgi:hypothetical protein
MNKRDEMAYNKITEIYNQYGGEGNDILYQYMTHHMNDNIYKILFLDEFENITGINKHEDVVDFILEKIEDERW